MYLPRAKSKVIRKKLRTVILILSYEFWRYCRNGEILQVPFPPDDILVFDVEVCIAVSAHPIIAVALSSDAWWVEHNVPWLVVFNFLIFQHIHFV